MADFPEIAAPDADVADYMDLFDTDQWDNFAIGLSEAGFGINQALTEAKEALGLVPEGTTEFETQEMNRDRKILREAAADDQELTGAGGFEFTGQTLPLFAVPFGATVGRAAGLGGLTSAGFYHEDPENQSRLVDIGTGAALGGLFKRLLQGAGPATEKARGSVNALIRSTRGPNRFERNHLYERILRGRRALPNTPMEDLGRATIVPDGTLGGPVARDALQGPQISGLLPPPKPKAVDPRQRPIDLIGPDDLQNAGNDILRRVRGASSFPNEARLAQEAIDTFKAARKGLTNKKAEEAMKKAARLSASMQRRAKAAQDRVAKWGRNPPTKLQRELTSALYDSIAANAFAKGLMAHLTRKALLKTSTVAKNKQLMKLPKATRPQPRERGPILLGADPQPAKAARPKITLAERPKQGKTPDEIAADDADRLARVQGEAAPVQDTSEVYKKGKRAYFAGQPVTKRDLVQKINRLLPGNQQLPLDPKDFTVDQLIEFHNKVNRNMKGQEGFIANDLVNTLGGATLGAMGGAAISDGDPLAIAAGAISFGAGFRAGGKWLDKVQTNKMREGMRKASEQGGHYDETISRAVKARDWSEETLSKILTSGGNVLDQFMGSTMTRLEALAPRVAVALKNAEYQTHVRANQWMKQGDQVFKKIDAMNLTDDQARRFKIALLNSTKSGKAYLRSIGKDTSAIDEFDAMLSGVARYLGGVDLGQNLRANYFPRMVTDISYFEKIKEVDDYLKHLAKKKGIDLTDFEKEIAITEVINGALTRGPEQTHFGKAAASLKKRTVKVDSKNVDAYADPHQGFNDYIESIVTQVERRRFFKDMGVKVDDLGPNAENIETVAQRLASELRKGNMTPEEVNETAQLIRMRFGPGEQAPSKAVQNFKNLTYTGLLGNPLAAMTQFGDLALSAHRNGIVNTTRSILQNLHGKNNPLRGLDKEELLGIRNAASDFASRTSTRDLLNWSLKYSGFQKTDQFGKNTFIQSAMLKNQQMDKSDFMQKWGKIFDPDATDPNTLPRTEKLWKDVQEFKGLTPQNREDLGFMLWNELEGVQPIALSSLPQRYLQHPNGRMAYMLQSFTLKLFDVMRKDIYNHVKNKNFTQAAKNAGRLTSLFVSMNASVEAAKNFVLNKETDVPNLVMNNFMKMAGFNKYMFDSVGRDGLGSTALQTIAPPTILFDAATDPNKALQMLPIGGKIVEGRIPE